MNVTPFLSEMCRVTREGEIGKTGVCFRVAFRNQGLMYFLCAGDGLKTGTVKSNYLFK